MKITVLDAGTLGSDVNLTPFYEVGEVELFENTAPDEIAARIKESDVVCINKIKLNEGNLSGSAVRVICVAATGYDNIDTVYCKKQGIAVCNVPGYSTHSVAQLSVAMALYLVNHLSEYRSFVHSGEYSRSGVANRLTPVWHELYGQTWGIVGGGNIGGQVARVAEAFGCRVLVCRRKKDPHFETVDIDTLCRESDIISLHVPLSEETRGMISAERIAMMKEGAILINVARGAVTDEGAVADAVESGHLGGIGIDVFSAEPLPEEHPYHRITDQDNVILTPHTAWGSLEARNRVIREMAENIRAFYEGRERNRVDK